MDFPAKLPCGSLRHHEPHDWNGSNYPHWFYNCPGWPLKRGKYAPRNRRKPMTNKPTNTCWKSISRREMGSQPPPIPNDKPSIHDLFVSELYADYSEDHPDVDLAFLAKEVQDRKADGLNTYGTILQAGNGRDAIQDAKEEVLDACVYLLQAKEESEWENLKIYVLYDQAVQLLIKLHKFQEQRPRSGQNPPAAG